MDGLPVSANSTVRCSASPRLLLLPRRDRRDTDTKIRGSRFTDPCSDKNRGTHSILVLDSGDVSMGIDCLSVSSSSRDTIESSWDVYRCTFVYQRWICAYPSNEASHTTSAEQRRPTTPGPSGATTVSSRNAKGLPFVAFGVGCKQPMPDHLPTPCRSLDEVRLNIPIRKFLVSWRHSVQWRWETQR